MTTKLKEPSQTLRIRNFSFSPLRKHLSSTYTTKLFLHFYVTHEEDVAKAWFESLEETRFPHHLENFIRISRAFSEFLREISSMALSSVLQQYLRLRLSQGCTKESVFSDLRLFEKAIEKVASRVSFLGLPEDRTLFDLLLPMESVNVLNNSSLSVKEEENHPCPTPALFIVNSETSSPSFWTLNPDADIKEKAEKMSSAPLVGALVDRRYRIIRYISNGSFKHGWLAIDTMKIDSRRRCDRVFLSTMRALHDGGSHKETRKEMRREMRVSRLLHKHLFSSSSLEHIVAVRDVTTRPRMIELQNGLSANIHFIVSDFCEANLYEFCSHSLTRFFPRQELNAATYSEFLSQCNFLDSVARALFRHLVHAVLCLHEKGLYHCDIKLDNILVKRSVNSGELVLALGDFGRLSTTSAVFHSNPPVYAPPEASKRGVLFDAGPADVYSCGTCLLQLVTLTYWSVETPDCSKGLKYAMKQMNDAVRRYYKDWLPKDDDIPSLEKYLNHDLIDLMSKMLDPDPCNRPNVTEILKHPWMTSIEEAKPSLVTADLLRRHNPNTHPRNQFKLKLKNTSNLDEYFDRVSNVASTLCKTHQSARVYNIDSRILTIHLSDFVCKCSVLRSKTLKRPYLLVEWLGGGDRAESWLKVNMAFVAEFKDSRVERMSTTLSPSLTSSKGRKSPPRI